MSNISFFLTKPFDLFPFKEDGGSNPTSIAIEEEKIKTLK